MGAWEGGVPCTVRFRFNKFEGGGVCTVRSKLNKFEHVQGDGDLYIVRSKFSKF